MWPMKKSITRFLLPLVLLLRMSFAGNCQVTDTICVPMAQLKKVLTDAKQKPVLLEKIDLLTTDIKLLNERIVVKDSIINLMERDELASQEIISALREEKKLMLEQRKVFEDQLNAYEKLLRKERRKRRWTAVGGIMLTGAATYLYLTK